MRVVGVKDLWGLRYGFVGGDDGEESDGDGSCSFCRWCWKGIRRHVDRL